MYLTRDDWTDDPHRNNPDVHYRLYVGHDNDQPAVICVQDFDYVDYDARRILSPDAWDAEADAEAALAALLSTIKAADVVLPRNLDTDMRIRMLAAAVRDYEALPPEERALLTFGDDA